MGFLTATAGAPSAGNVRARFAAYAAIAGSGFRRYATYRQATVAAAVTNSAFGFLKTYVLLAAAGLTGVAAGYDRAQLATFVWVGQGLIGVVAYWGWTDLSDRIRTGDVVTDLLRPVPPVLSYLAADLGRAAYGALARFLVPVVVGALAFDLFWPGRAVTYPLFVVSVLLAVVISFGGRYLINATAFWLLDNRGVQLAWLLLSGVLSGLYFPLPFLPDWALNALRLGTPFPSMLQTPLDVVVEHDSSSVAFGLVAVQFGWAVLLLAACQWVQRRAEHKLVIQGG